MTNRILEQSRESVLLITTKPFRIVGLVPEGDEPAAVGMEVDGHTYIVMGPRDMAAEMKVEATAWASDPYLNFCYMRAAFMNRMITQTVEA
jgi:hypothetical protein